MAIGARSVIDLMYSYLDSSLIDVGKIKIRIIPIPMESVPERGGVLSCQEYDINIAKVEVVLS